MNVGDMSSSNPSWGLFFEVTAPSVAISVLLILSGKYFWAKRREIPFSGSHLGLGETGKFSEKDAWGTKLFSLYNDEQKDTPETATRANTERSLPV